MKVAVATEDGARVAPHAGRCAGFVIYGVSSGAPKRVELRRRTGAEHAHEACHGEHDHAGRHVSHEGILDALAGCGALVCGGIGPRLVADLEARGILAYLDAGAGVGEAARRLLENALPRANAHSPCPQRSTR